jgi:hypothetical protein
MRLTPKQKSLAAKQLLAIANSYEPKKRKSLRGITYKDGVARWVGQAHDYSVKIEMK